MLKTGGESLRFFDINFDIILLYFFILFYTFLYAVTAAKKEKKNPETIGNPVFSGFGGSGWIRTTEVVDNRFTVCKKSFIINGF